VLLLYYYYCYNYYAAFNAPCIGHKDDELQAQIPEQLMVGFGCFFNVAK